MNSGLIRAFTSRSDDAQNSSVVSIEAPDIHDLPNHGCPSIQKTRRFATVVLGRVPAATGKAAKVGRREVRAQGDGAWHGETPMLNSLNHIAPAWGNPRESPATGLGITHAPGGRCHASADHHRRRMIRGRFSYTRISTTLTDKTRF